jgi:hypothetical protein
MNPLPFEELAQLGRSIIPAAAPGWTDHNTHDPGIMLLELLAWIAEAQMYGVSRTRKDERLAFASLIGLAPEGPQPASGLVWADGITPAPWPAGYVVEPRTPVRPDLADPPPFFTTETIELTTATLSRVLTRFADGSTGDWTAANTEDGATFMPFGTSPSAGDRLVLEFDGTLSAAASDKASLSIGFQIVHADGDRPATNVGAGPRPRARRTRLAATLRVGREEWPLRIVSDTTDGLLRTGVLLVRVPAGAAADGRSEIWLRSATGGFMRPPRVLQVAPNVLPIEQVELVQEPRAFGNDTPDQTYALEQRGLMFPFDDRPISLTVHEGAQSQTWTRVDTFDASGPRDPHFTVDERAGTLGFGNGINGRVVAAGSSIEVDYSVCRGSQGNQPAHLRWTVTGIAGSFGRNVVPIDQGSDGRGLADLRRLARTRIGTTRPIVTARDLEAAALALADLGVSRASELALSDACTTDGARILLVVGPHDDDGNRPGTESEELRAEIHARLAPRLPLGQRLSVMSPRYTSIRVHADVVAAPRVDADDLRDRIVAELRSRLAIVPTEMGKGWPFGRDVDAMSISGWIARLDGVAAVRAAQVSSDPASASADVISLGRTGLPLLDADGSEIAIARSAAPPRQASSKVGPR